MITGDEKKWSESTDEQLFEIAKKWAKRFTYKELRAFQAFYTKIIKELPENSDTEIKYKAYDNMWRVTTWAISEKCFGR